MPRVSGYCFKSSQSALRPAGRASPGRPGNPARCAASNVGVVLVGGDRLADPRQDVAEESEVEPAQHGPRGRENSRIATLPPGRATRIISSMPRAVSPTLRRPKATLTMPNVSLGQGQPLGVAFDERHPPARPGLPDLVAAEDEHLAAEVGGDDRRAAPAARS